ncbi:MAG TPA: flagellar filament capping protein FliD [Opitutus sp.]|nr:flagellar filament capping protein FliD [Opitutus sp.]
MSTSAISSSSPTSTSSVDLGLSGLASGFDWKSFVNQMMAVEHAPADRLASEQTDNSGKSDKLSILGTKITALKAATDALNEAGLFSRSTAALGSTTSNWAVTAADGTAAGSYKIAVSQLATTAQRAGGSDIASALSATSNVSSLTLASLPAATPVTAGKFTVNGQRITVALTDSLQDVFDAISDATDGAVTASYDPTTDKVSLSSASEITLGAANDSSNFLAVMRLANNGDKTITSSGSLGAAALHAPLANARLSSALTAVDGSGNGSFTINGETIAYNVNTDSLSDVLQRINDSAAGVTAAYDGASDRVVLTNKITGDFGLSANEASGGLLDALGLTGDSTFTRGLNAQYSLNGGPTLTSTSNTLTASSHGITGLEVTVDSESANTVTVAKDTSTMQSKIQDFISAFNDVEGFINDETKITTDSSGTVTTGVLSSNREVQDWARTLRSKAFAQVGGLNGAITRLESIGIDFTSGTNELAIKDQTKLTDALRNNAEDVGKLFQTSGTGLANVIGSFADKISSLDDDQQKRLSDANADLDRQIADIERRLDEERSQMEAAFIRMEDAQSSINSQSQALSKAFGS